VLHFSERIVAENARGILVYLVNLFFDYSADRPPAGSPPRGLENALKDRLFGRFRLFLDGRVIFQLPAGFSTHSARKGVKPGREAGRAG